MSLPLSPRQLEFVFNSTARWNLAHGPVRSGKTIGTLFRFMQAVNDCPDSQIVMAGHTSETIYQNTIRLLMETEQLSIFRPFCTIFTSQGKKGLKFKDKTITTLGAKDEGAIGQFQGRTFSVFYGDEMTLFPDSIIDMIDTRLSNPHSIAFASMNPSYPAHKLKQWIDKAQAGDPNYYELQFMLDHNPFVDENYKNRIRNSLSGVFYRRNYLGQWCLAQGAVFDFFDRKTYVVKRPPRAAEYWIAGIDYGTNNNFACVLIGISTGKYDQTGVSRWVEKEYVWDSNKEGRQKTNSEYADDVCAFLEAYAVNQIYMDPSAASFKLELRRRGFPIIDANNEVKDGINYVTSEMKAGNLFVCECCPRLINELESYVWDAKASEKGEDRPVKKDDHCIDALRYAVVTHRVISYQPYKDTSGGDEYLKGRFNPAPRRF